MSLLKEVINGGIIGWSGSKKHNYLFALAQTTTTTTTTTNSQEMNGDQLLLQIMAFDAAEKRLEPNRLGATFMQVAATSITWSTFGEDSGKYPYGLICVGHHDGSFVIYDANQIILSTKNNPDVIASNVGKLSSIKEFNVPVYATEYNSYKPNLIAIGGDEVLVIDISRDIENPDIIAPGDTNLHQGGIITSVSWNKKVPHILASASNDGVAVVWNLKTSQVSFQIPDIYQHQPGPKQLSLAWNPEIPLQFAINYDDEKKPELHIWDLRDTRGPYVSLENGHVLGIQTLSWSTIDPSLIITGGVDNKVVCWNIKTKEIIQSFYLDTKILDIQWSKIPSLYSVALADATIQLYALHQDEIDAHPPKWYQPTVGATFAPNNILTSFSEFSKSEIRSKQYQTKDENYQLYLRWFQELEKVIDDTNSAALCDLKLKNTHVEDTFELDQWRLLRGVAFGNNKEILESLGFNKSEIIKKAEDYTGKKHKFVVETEDQTNKIPQNKQKQSIEFTPVNEEQADDFFNNLTATNTQYNAQPTIPQTDLNGSQMRRKTVSNEEEVYMTEQVSKNRNWDVGVEKMIKENMIVGNYEGAIDCAMKCGRVAEALLIAYSQSADLFESSINQYFTQQTDNFIKYVFKNLIKNDINDIADNYDLKSWRECAGLAITTSKNPIEFQFIINKLAERFIKEKNDDDSAICCFILSQNFQGLVEIYFKRIQALRGNIKQRAYYMVQSIEKLIILKKVMLLDHTISNNHTQQLQQEQVQNHNGKFDSILLELSKIALSNTRISIAYKILQQGNPVQLHIAELKDLLYNVYFDELADKFTRPIQPYSFIRISPQQQYTQSNNNNNNNNTNNNQINFNQHKGGNNQTNFTNQSNVQNFTNQSNLNKDNINRQFNQSSNLNPPITSPVNAFAGNPSSHKITPFNPRGGQKESAPPIMPLMPGKQFNPPPIMSNQVSQNEMQAFSPTPPSNPNQYKQFGNKEIQRTGPPANPNNKQFTESIGSKSIGPPRPIATANKTISQNSSQINAPPPFIQDNRSLTTNPQFVPQTFNENLSKVNLPPSHIAPPANIRPNPINRNAPTKNPVLQKQDAVPPPPINPNIIRQGSNIPGGNTLPNVPQTNSNAPYSHHSSGGIFHPHVPNQTQQNQTQFVNQDQNQFDNQNQNQFPQNQNLYAPNQKPQNVMSETRPPISMKQNNVLPPAQFHPQSQSQSHNMTAPAPPCSNVGIDQQKTQSAQNKNIQYNASAQEIQIIEIFVNNNMGIFGLIDPKKKEDHFSQLNNLIILLKSQQLKQEQVNLLIQISQQMANDNQKEALITHSKLARIDFPIHKHWLTTLKRLIVQK